MVPLPSHSLKQWGQLGEILGGVKFSDETPSLVLCAAHAWGSSVEYRQQTKHKTKVLVLETAGTSMPFSLKM